MFTKDTISLKKILWKVMNHPLAVDLNYEDAAMYAIEAIELIGTPLTLVDKESSISIVDYKGSIPNDMIILKGVISDNGIVLNHNTGIYTTNNWVDQDYIQCRGGNYTIERGVIKTSFEKGNIVLAYKALPTDCDGYPLIPNQVKVKRAVHYYILFEHLAPFYDIGKITDKAFHRITQEKDWYIGAAQSATQLSSMDHAEAMVNSINRLLIDSNASRNFYQTLGQKENIKKL
jgi:hypothetical protein